MRVTFTKWRIALWAAVLLLAPIAEAASPTRIAVVLSREGIALSSYVPQRTGYGWLGVAALAGVPYRTLFVEDLGSDGAALAKEYGAIVLPELHALTDANYERLTQTMRAYRKAGGAIVLDGPPGIWNETGEWRGEGALHDALDCRLGGFVGDSRCRVTVAAGAGGTHVVTRGWSDGQAVTPPFTIGFNALVPGSRAGTEPHVLLEATGTGEKFPWLSCVETETSRVVLIGGVFGAGDAASLFRNGQDRFPDPPNRVYDVLVSALQWALYGDDTGPIPALQFCAADAAVMIRLDGDHSDRPGDFEQTFSYLFAIAEESGVGAAYGIVTGRADEAGWSRFAPLAKQLEELGGEIGTHTHTHGIYGVIDDDIGARELDESIRAIDHDLEAAGYDAEGVPFLINPNGMIPMTAHGEISSRFPLFLTHGISASVPVAYGVSTWFAESDPPFAVIYDSPEPDFQWLYAREWSYTAAEAGEIESAIFRHYTNEIGRGVLFDMMWHDYGIASSGYDQSRPRFRWADLFKPARKKSASNRPLFDMLRGEFAEASIYCPEPLEAAEKLRIMQGADYMWSREGSALVFTIDLTGSDEFALACAGGLGLRIDRAQLPIRSVTINGNDHPAFTDDVVILPALEAGMTRVTVRFGADNGRSRLLYLSKRPHRIRAVHDGSQDELNASFEAEGVARFTVRPAGPNPCVRGVDEFRVRMRDGERIVDGRNRGGGSMIVEASPPHFPQWDSAEGAVESLETAGDGFRIELDARHLPEVTLRFRTEETVTFARMHGGTEERIRSRAEGTLQVLTIPAPREHSRITGTIGGGS